MSQRTDNRTIRLSDIAAIRMLGKVFYGPITMFDGNAGKGPVMVSIDWIEGDIHCSITAPSERFMLGDEAKDEVMP